MTEAKHNSVAIVKAAGGANSLAKLFDEIASLELLAEMAADLEQNGRVRYCKRRIKTLRALVAGSTSTSPSMLDRGGDR